MKASNSIAFSITSNYDSIDSKEVFERLLKVLMAYSYKLIGEGTLRLSKSRSELAYDFAMEAITRYKEEPSKFDPSRNADLVNYLKFYVLRQLISNQKKSKGQENELLFEKEDSNGMIVMNTFIEENEIHEMIDLENTIQLIQKEVEGEQKLLEVFDYRYIKDFSRAETIETLKITPGEYNNRIRRLDTVRKNVVKMQQQEIKV